MNFNKTKKSDIVPFLINILKIVRYSNWLGWYILRQNKKKCKLYTFYVKYNSPCIYLEVHKISFWFNRIYVKYITIVSSKLR